MNTRGTLLQSLDAISLETSKMLETIERSHLSPEDRREAKRRVLQLRAGAHELIEWFSAPLDAN